MFQDWVAASGHAPASQSRYCVAGRDLGLYDQLQRRDSVQIYAIVFKILSGTRCEGSRRRSITGNFRTRRGFRWRLEHVARYSSRVAPRVEHCSVLPNMPHFGDSENPRYIRQFWRASAPIVYLFGTYSARLMQKTAQNASPWDSVKNLARRQRTGRAGEKPGGICQRVTRNALEGAFRPKKRHSIARLG
jgi:hypothetical protein